MLFTKVNYFEVAVFVVLKMQKVDFSVNRKNIGEDDGRLPTKAPLMKKSNLKVSPAFVLIVTG